MTPPSWPELHGAVTHFPVALLLAGAAFDVGSLVLRKPEWRTVGFWMLALAVVMAVPSILFGFMTANTLFHAPARPPEIVYDHRAGALTTAVLAVIALAWRVARRDRTKGGGAYGPLAVSLLAAASVGYTGYLGGRMVLGSAGQAAEPDKVSSVATDPKGASQAVPAAVADPKLVAEGQALFLSADMGCTNCHTYNGKGGKVGPDLTRIGQVKPDPKWHVAHLKNPRQVNPRSTMPSFDTLSEDDLRALAAFLSTRR